jgi:hypothetical protein
MRVQCIVLTCCRICANAHVPLCLFNNVKYVCAHGSPILGQGGVLEYLVLCGLSTVLRY